MMKSSVAEIVRITEALPPKERSQVLEFARALVKNPGKQQENRKPQNGDEQWEEIISNPRRRPKLEAKVKELDKLIAAGKTEPMP